MSLDNELVKKYRQHEKDTGSVPHQLALLKEKIEQEKIHLTNNKKDIPTKRALLKRIAYKKKLLQYLKKNDPGIYEELKG